jgi:hypothetical protein
MAPKERIWIVARPERFELPTSWFVAMHSIQLSYGRIIKKSRDSIMHAGGFYSIEDGGEGGIRTLDGAINPILP